MGCPVCFRVACPLRSHKQYAKSRRLYGTPTAGSSRQFLTSVNTTSSTESLEGRQRTYPRLTQISAGEVDPFVAFPLPNGAKVEVHQLFQDFFILHQTKSTTGPKAGPSPLTPLTKEILSASSNSEALCHSIVATSAIWHASYRGQREPDPRLLSLHGQALQVFRKGLTNPATAYCNANILAAASLTHQQVFCRSPEGLKTHVSGIEALIKARGGLHNVGWIAYIILWIDYYTCLYVNQEPRFTWSIDNSIRLNVNPERKYGSAFDSLQLQALLDPELRQMCLEVCRTVELLESTTGKASPKLVHEYYRYKRTTMCIQLGHLHARFHSHGTINECVSLTVNILVLQVFFMHVLDESRMDLCGKLRIALELAAGTFTQSEFKDVFVWILFVAGAVAPEMSPWKGWFINRLRVALATTCPSAVVSSSSEMSPSVYMDKVLRSHAWSEKLLAHVFETTCHLIKPSATKAFLSEKTVASAYGLFPG